MIHIGTQSEIGRPIAYQPIFGDGGSASIRPERGDCYPDGWITREYAI